MSAAQLNTLRPAHPLLLAAERRLVCVCDDLYSCRQHYKLVCMPSPEMLLSNAPTFRDRLRSEADGAAALAVLVRLDPRPANRAVMRRVRKLLALARLAFSELARNVHIGLKTLLLEIWTDVAANTEFSARFFRLFINVHIALDDEFGYNSLPPRQMAERAAAAALDQRAYRVADAAEGTSVRAQLRADFETLAHFRLVLNVPVPAPVADERLKKYARLAGGRLLEAVRADFQSLAQLSRPAADLELDEKVGRYVDNYRAKPLFDRFLFDAPSRSALSVASDVSSFFALQLRMWTCIHGLEKPRVLAALTALVFGMFDYQQERLRDALPLPLVPVASLTPESLY